ncbi:hypothetical protein BDA96_05G176000 [Sorghum bicolor]|uniref:Cytochrome P450 n=1 Tax=Sorghum bicolor TaxID=4558 RepID=A0A921UFS3_SORBI|nr:hypothetical protein BDA96_05G176000 [Sorghum bicolor]
MDMANGVVWFTIAVVFITVVISKATKRGIMFDPKCNRLCSFYQGLDSEISHGNMIEFTVPCLARGWLWRGHATRNEQSRFSYDALKPSKLRSHAGPMIQEVGFGQIMSTTNKRSHINHLNHISAILCTLAQIIFLDKNHKNLRYFASGTAGMVDLKQELTVISIGPMLTGEGGQEKMFDEFFTLFHELSDNGMCLTRKHTSTITSVWTGAHLLASTRSLASVLEEQKKIMDTLHRCIKETLRIHPPVPMFRRKVHKNFTVQTKDGNEYEIHRGHTLISPVQFNGNLPHIYKDPDVYDPDRFGPGREEDRVGGKFSYTSFSAGRHACLGESYAYLQIKVIWSYLLRNFELKLESPFPKPDWTKLVPEPKGRVMVSYKKRVLPTI